MKYLIHLLLFLLLFISEKSSAQSLNRLIGGTYNTDLVAQHLNEIDLMKNDTNYKYSLMPLNQKILLDQHFPYPVIFIHGLSGSADTWLEFYEHATNQGWSFGGQLLFNLNSDNDLTYSNIYSANIDIIDFNVNLPAADFYVVNFNCDIEGNPFGDNASEPSKSNQSAITKQGLAIRNAVNSVILATGKEKVVLFGHSMGGLAARQYIQNPNFWTQGEGHNVAKLITSGTPHGGSNTSGTVFSQAFTDIDERSDAVRDLRESYFYSGDFGVFLYGGLESSSVMNDNILGFYNYDVTCDGQAGGFVQGLNFKDIYTDLDYSSIIGDWTWNVGGDGDGVVSVFNAQLKNLYNITSETFTIESNFILEILHSSMPDYMRENYYALDEPDYYDLAYEISVNEVYNGFKTEQAPDAEYIIDYDDFIFAVSNNSTIRVRTYNSSNTFLGVALLRADNETLVFNEGYGNSGEYLTEEIELSAGSYILEYYSSPNEDDWLTPYAFIIETDELSSVEIAKQDTAEELIIFPNPSEDEINFNFPRDFDVEIIQVYTAIGQLVLTKDVSSQLTNPINIADLKKGAYKVLAYSDKGVVVGSFVKN